MILGLTSGAGSGPGLKSGRARLGVGVIRIFLKINMALKIRDKPEIDAFEIVYLNYTYYINILEDAYGC